MEIRKGNTLRKRWICALLALSLSCSTFAHGDAITYASPEAVRLENRTDFDGEGIQLLSTTETKETSVGADAVVERFEAASVGEVAVSERSEDTPDDVEFEYTDSDLQRLDALNKEHSVEDFLHVVSDTDPGLLSSNPDILIRDANEYHVLADQAYVREDSGVYTDVEAMDGEIFYVHVNDNLYYRATSSNAVYLGSEFDQNSPTGQDTLALEVTGDNRLAVHPNQTGFVSVTNEFEDEGKNRFTTANTIIAYSHLVFDYNDGSGDIATDTNRLYPSQNEDGSDAGTDEIVIGEINGTFREGYVFLGWNTQPDGSGVSVFTGDKIKTGTFTGNVVLYAIWALDERQYHEEEAKDVSIQYTIRYEKGDGEVTGEMEPSVMYSDVASKLRPNEFRRDGFTFIGWQMEKDGRTLSFAPEVSVMNLASEDGEEVVLHAIWMKNKEAKTSLQNPESADRLKVIKILNGEGMEQEKDFRFRLRAISSTSGFALPMPIGARGRQVYEFTVRGGMSRELEELTFHAPGVYRYRLEEIELEDSNYEYDKSHVEVIYTVVKRGDHLRAVRYLLKDGMQIADATFVNRYIGRDAIAESLASDDDSGNATGASNDESDHTQEVTPGTDSDGESVLINDLTPNTTESTAFLPVTDFLEIQTYLNGEIPLEAKEFSYRMIAIDHGSPLPEEVTFSRLGSGSAGVKELTFTSPGIYKYRIEQITKNSDGYTLDDSDIEITYIVTATDNELDLDRSMRKDGKYVNVIQFNNHYELPRITIRFDTDGAEEEIESQTIPAGEYVSVPFEPKKPGYVFVHWAMNGERFDFSNPLFRSETLVAVWEAKVYRVEFRDAFDADNGHSDQWIQTVTTGHGEAASPPPAPNHKLGYHFLKWDSSIREIVQDQVVHAVYAPNTYEVYFDANSPGVQGITLSKRFTYDMADELPMNGFVKQNDMFLGWSTSPDGEVEYRDKEVVQNLTSENEGIVTLYAVWASGRRKSAAVQEPETSKNNLFPGESGRTGDTLLSEDSMSALSGSFGESDILIRRSDASVLSAAGVTKDITVLRYHIDENGNGVITQDGRQSVIEPKEFSDPNRLTGFDLAADSAERTVNSEVESNLNANARNRTDSNSIPKTSDAFDALSVATFGFGILLFYVYLRKSRSGQ